MSAWSRSWQGHRLGDDSAISAIVRRANTSGPLAELLDMGRVSRLSEAHARGAGNFTAIIYSAFILDQWFEKWMGV